MTLVRACRSRAAPRLAAGQSPAADEHQDSSAHGHVDDVAFAAGACGGDGCEGFGDAF